MAFKIAEAYVEFSQKGVSSVTKGVSASEKAMRGLATAGRLASAAFTWMAGGEIIRGMNFFISSAAEAEKQTAKLAAVLKSTNGVSGQTVASLERHASALQQVTAFEDDTIKGAQAVLLTFKKIGGETFPQATEAALDLATVFEGDLKGSAMMVGKALEDPIRGITALRRAGVSFTKDQQDVIASLVKTGEVAKAQAMILKEINSQVGGSARAVGDTTFGQIEQLKNAAGDAAEEIGQALVPALKGFTSALRFFQKESPWARAENAKFLGAEMTKLNKDLMAATNQKDANKIVGKINSLMMDAASLGVVGAVETGASFARSPAMRNRIAGLPTTSATTKAGSMVYPMDQNLLNEMGGLDAGLQGRDVAGERAAAKETAEIMRNYSNLQRNPGIGGRKGGAFAGYPDLPMQGPAGYSAFKDAPAGVFGQFDKLVNQFEGLKAKTDNQTRVLEQIRDKVGTDEVSRYE